MAKREMLFDDQLDSVAGGVTYTNYYQEADGSWCDGKTFKLRTNAGNWSYTFKSSDYNAVKAIIDANYDPSLGSAASDAKIMAALLATNYLTPIT